MRPDTYVFARMRNWNPKLNLLDREAVVAAWRRSVNFDIWHLGVAHISDIHAKLLKGETLTEGELTEVSKWNGMVPPEILDSHGLKVPMQWAFFARHLQEMRGV